MENPGGGRLSAMGLLMLAVVVIGISSRIVPVLVIRYTPLAATQLGKPDGDFYPQHHYSHLYALTGLATLAGIVFSIYTQAGYAWRA